MVTVVRAGKAVTLLWRLTQTVPPPAFTYDPPSLPLVTIFDPTGATQVGAQAAVKISPGYYAYTYVTPANPSAGQLGIWTAWIDTVDAGGNPAGSVDSTNQAKASQVFQVV